MCKNCPREEMKKAWEYSSSEAPVLGKKTTFPISPLPFPYNPAIPTCLDPTPSECK